jgi:hypothetical protein
MIPIHKPKPPTKQTIRVNAINRANVVAKKIRLKLWYCLKLVLVGKIRYLLSPISKNSVKGRSSIISLTFASTFLKLGSSRDRISFLEPVWPIIELRFRILRATMESLAVPKPRRVVTEVWLIGTTPQRIDKLGNGIFSDIRLLALSRIMFWLLFGSYWQLPLRGILTALVLVSRPWSGVSAQRSSPPVILPDSAWGFPSWIGVRIAVAVFVIIGVASPVLLNILPQKILHVLSIILAHGQRPVRINFFPIA